MKWFWQAGKGKRYAINSINTVIHKFDMETVLYALAKIPAALVTAYKISECHEKESCLVAELVLFISEMQEKQAA